ncbi:sigma factor-like helix-turn-helix DNA-binding protein [Streptomyces sp. NPDC088116]|uniref:sigma factor-like helix-turn-helix DNA-binding protein n=1 Tax=Streptomyces sp. NPDC088116 TaxID=3365825 RepID=UPI0037F452ED
MTQNTTHSTTAGDSLARLPPPEERRTLREAKSLTEKQIATVVGVTRSTIRSWESGRTAPRGRKGEAYARVLADIAAEIRAKAAQAERAQRAAEMAAAERTAARRRSESAPRHHTKAPYPSRPAHLARSPQSAYPPRSLRATGSAVPTTAAAGTATDPAPALDPAFDPALEATAGAGAGAGPEAGTEAEARIGTETGNEARVRTGAGNEAGIRTEAGNEAGIRTEAGNEAGVRTEAGNEAGVGTGSETGAWTGTEAGAGTEAGPLTPDQAFDALYAYAAPSLVRQAYLLTGRRSLSQESVERAFYLAWQRWPEVAVDRDPAGWVRAAAYEYAMSPWHRIRRTGKPSGPPPGEHEGPGARELRQALLDLPASYRRALLLYDGLGLDLPETAAETEASTPAVANRLMNAREALAKRLPELTDAELLHERLGALTRAVTPPSILPARTVRNGCERRSKFWTRTAIAFTALIVGATGFTLATAPTRYEPPQAPGERIGGVPVNSGPERLSPEDLRLRDMLRSEQMNGPPRLVPQTE